jgi:hypothetical protein
MLHGIEPRKDIPVHIFTQDGINPNTDIIGEYHKTTDVLNSGCLTWANPKRMVFTHFMGDVYKTDYFDTLKDLLKKTDFIIVLADKYSIVNKQIINLINEYGKKATTFTLMNKTDNININGIKWFDNDYDNMSYQKLNFKHIDGAYFPFSIHNRLKHIEHPEIKDNSGFNTLAYKIINNMKQNSSKTVKNNEVTDCCTLSLLLLLLFIAIMVLVFALFLLFSSIYVENRFDPYQIDLYHQIERSTDVKPSELIGYHDTMWEKSRNTGSALADLLLGETFGFRNTTFGKFQLFFYLNENRPVLKSNLNKIGTLSIDKYLIKEKLDINAPTKNLIQTFLSEEENKILVKTIQPYVNYIDKFVLREKLIQLFKSKLEVMTYTKKLLKEFDFISSHNKEKENYIVYYCNTLLSIYSFRTLYNTAKTEIDNLCGFRNKDFYVLIYSENHVCHDFDLCNSWIKIPVPLETFIVEQLQ